MARRAAALMVFITILGIVSTAIAQGTRQIRVSLEFRQTGTSESTDLGGNGSIVIHRGGSVVSRGGVGGSSTTTRTRRSTGIFTIVQDGGYSTLNVATRVPYREVAFFRDYATGAGYVTSGVDFENVGTALKVTASVLEGDRIRVRLTPTISYFSAERAGAIDFTEAATELVVRNGEDVMLGGATSDTNEIVRRVLGLGSAISHSETTLVFRASLL